MLAQDIEEILREHADEGVRLGLSSGEFVDIPHAGAVRISGMRMIIFPDLQVGRLYTDRPVRYVSVVNVASVTPIADFKSPGSN